MLFLLRGGLRSFASDKIRNFELTTRRDFWQNLSSPRSGSGRGRFSRQPFSLVQTYSRTINQSGERKGFFYENKNFTHGKFHEPLVPPLRDSPGTFHSARARSHMADACAEGLGAVPANMRHTRQHS